MKVPPLSRRAALLAAALAVAVVFGVAARSPAQESGGEAILSQDGWWNRLQGPQEGEPNVGVRPVLSPVPPPPNTVPDNGIAVGASGGEPDKVAAVGIVLSAPMDAFVDRLVLTLVETEENGSNINEGQATVLACPITTFWAGTSNGNWQNRPACDDAQAVEGERADDGTWTFDLTFIGQSWLDGTLTELGVLLVEGVDPPQSFQVSYQNVASGEVQVDFATTGGGISGSSVFEPEPAPPAAPVEPTPRSSAPPAATNPPTTSATTSPPTTAAAAPSAPPAAPPPPATLDADIWGNLPVGVLVWLPLALAVAGVVGMILGPRGRPAAATRRAGSVSRVLDARQNAR